MIEIEVTETGTTVKDTKVIAIIGTGSGDMIITPVTEAIVMINIRVDAGFRI